MKITQNFFILWFHTSNKTGISFVKPIFYTTFAHMKTNKTTTRLLVASAICATLAAFAACSSKPKTNDIIAKKPVKAAPKPTQNMGDYSQQRTVEWLGGTYSVNVERKADPSLPLAADESGNKYYDNRIMRVHRRRVQ